MALVVALRVRLSILHKIRESSSDRVGKIEERLWVLPNTSENFQELESGEDE